MTRIGATGTVITDIPGSNTPGEVVLRLEGGTETYTAYADKPIGRGTKVFVYEDRGGRVVDVVEQQ